MRILRATAAATALTALVVGIPITLAVAVGWPLPTRVPTGADVLNWVLNPLSSLAVVHILVTFVWILWAHFTACVTAEVINVLRDRHHHTGGRWAATRPLVLIPWGGYSQDLARRLVTAVLIGGTSLTGLSSATPADAVETRTVSATLADAEDGWAPSPASGSLLAPASPSGAALVSVAATSSNGQQASAEPQWRRYVVQAPVSGRYDCLWRIAETYLGDGERWPEIYDLNKNRTQLDGRALHDPDLIHPGWNLALPADATGNLPAWEGSAATDAPPAATAQAPNGGAREHFADGGASASDLDVDATSTPTAAPEVTASVERPDSGRAEPAPPAARPSRAPTPAADTAADGQATGEWPTWENLVPALAGGGALLAGGLYAALQLARRRQFRARRPGRMIAATPEDAVPVERALIEAGPSGAIHGDFLDAALRHLAAETSTSPTGVPRLIGARLTQTSVDIRLQQARTDGPTPWVSDEQGWWWSVPIDARFPDHPEQMAPYPTLVTIGHRAGNRWMLDLETAGTVRITGPGADDLARFIAAELAVNQWSDTIAVDITGLDGDLVGLNPDRVDTVDADTAVGRTRNGIRELHTNGTRHAAAGRTEQDEADQWMPRVVIAGPDTTSVAVEDLVQAMSNIDGAAIAIVVAGHAGATGSPLILDDHGRLTIDALDGLQLTAEALTIDETAAMSALLTTARDSDDVDIDDATETAVWAQFARKDGSLRRNLTVPRAAPQDCVSDAADRLGAHEAAHPGSVLPRPDQQYTAVAATTYDDLARLAPVVPEHTRTAVRDADPHLDADVTGWFADDCDLPRLRVLGPVEVKVPASGGRVPARLPYFATLLAYLATRERGATAEEIASAFWITAKRVRTDISTLRAWLGVNPRTGHKHIPDALRGAAGRGGVYTVEGILLDADLFLRLRTRSQASGPTGIHDLQTALSLVDGQPFERASGSWLIGGDRLDHHLTVAITDVAHTVVTHALADGNTALAERAAEVARRCDPNADLPELDTAAIRAAAGHNPAEHLATTVLARGDREDPAVPPRTIHLLAEHPEWLVRTGSD